MVFFEYNVLLTAHVLITLRTHGSYLSYEYGKPKIRSLCKLYGLLNQEKGKAGQIRIS